MALTVVSDNSKIGTGIQIGLGVDNQGNPDSVFVAAGATVASTTAVGISGISDNHLIGIEGTVFGEDVAISLGLNAQSNSHRIVVGETGYVGNLHPGSLAAPSSAVFIRGYNNTVENAGTIRGAAFGLTFEGDSPILLGTVSVNNTGLIEATRTAIVHADNSDQALIVKNTGEIRSTYVSQVGSYYSAIYSGGTAKDYIYNSGLIAGGIGLGFGDDLYDGRGGRIVAPLTGDVMVDAGPGQDILIGGDFREFFLGSGGDDDIDGGNGDDTLYGSAGEDELVGGGGNDEIFADSDADTVSGDAGNDRIEGGGASDTISGGADNDQIKGDEGDDIVSGDVGDDLLDGGAGKDTVSGGAGDDTVLGGAQDDTLSGDAGNDTLDGGIGADTLDGGAGNDTFLVDDAADVVSDFGGGADLVQAVVAFNLSSAATARGSIENLTLAGIASLAGTGNALANIITGNSGNNVLLGLAGNDTLVGNIGNDTLKGDAGNDVLNGGAGADKLYGGLGKDIMTGGAQADRFVFDTGPLGPANRDTITDFQHGVDRILVENAVFKGIAAGALKAASFHVGAAAHDADDRIVYNKATGALSYDADGTGATAAVQFAVLANKAVLTASDFLVI
jgi:Ca2+-binding RTX toxin-like protein